MRRKLMLKASEDDKATDTFIKRIKLLSTPNGLCGNYLCAKDSELKCKSKDAKAIHQPYAQGLPELFMHRKVNFRISLKGYNFHLPFFHSEQFV